MVSVASLADYLEVSFFRNCSESRERPHPSPRPGGRDSVNLTLSHINIAPGLPSYAGQCGRNGGRLLDVESFRRTVGKGPGMS